MRRVDLVRKVRSLTRDFSNSIFREQDIIDFINEGIDRVRQIIKELDGLKQLHSNMEEPTLFPAKYQHLLAVYAASRCFSQDERHYQATQLMNEFEIKMSDLKTTIENGEEVITDGDGNVVGNDLSIDYVDIKPYWGEPPLLKDIDEGLGE